jgi:branched-subunit amino acid aminotransferase/4-amino-4-deoxychorismate lyase
VGAGIVWDSNPAFEYDETLAKGEALLAALGGQWPGSEGRDGRPARPLPLSVPPEAGRAASSAEALAKQERPSLPSEDGPAEPVDARGVFETVLLAGGRPVFLDEHIDRFVAGCAFFGLADAPAAGALRTAVSEVIRSKGIADGVLRWAAWAGELGRTEWRVRVEAPRPHQLKELWKVEVSATPLPALGPETICKHLGRKAWRDALAAVRAAGSDEVVLTDAAGRVVEGAVSNVFCVQKGRLRTPSLACHPLPGIVRAVVLQLAGEHGLATEEGVVTADDLRTAEEVFLTNSLIGVRPVAWLDGRRLAAPGPVTSLLQAAFRQSWQ